MTTAAQARAVMRARIEANPPTDAESAAVAFSWQNEPFEIPATGKPFVYVEFLTDPAELVSFGGGRGNNRYRNPARLDAYVFVPKGEGLSEAESIAEQIATLFRSYRDASVSCFDASVFPGGDGALLKPPGLASDVGQYFWAAAEVSMFFDQIG